MPEGYMYTDRYISIPRVRDNVVLEGLCQRSEGRGFDTRRGKYVLSIYLILTAALGPGVYWASSINAYQRQKWNFLGGKAAAGAWGWQPHRHLRANWLDNNVGSQYFTALLPSTARYGNSLTYIYIYIYRGCSYLTGKTPIGLHGLLRR
jgi:hypothetical protein